MNKQNQFQRSRAKRNSTASRHPRHSRQCLAESQARAINLPGPPSTAALDFTHRIPDGTISRGSKARGE